MHESRPTIVAGSGRCGSTALSDALSSHPQTLVLSELFSSLQPFAFGAAPIDAARFAAILGTPRPESALLHRHRVEPSEYLYPVDAGGRFDRATGVPPLALTTLPHLTASIDGAFDEIIGDLRGRSGEAAPHVHVRALFDALAERFGGTHRIERSGASMAYLDRLLDLLPDARVVHIHRRGPDVAWSMSRHSIFRLTYLVHRGAPLCGRDPQVPPPSVGVLHDIVSAALGEPFSADAFWRHPIPPTWFAAVWAVSVRAGLRRLRQHDPDLVTHVRYDDLVIDPAGTLDRVRSAIGLDPNDLWLEGAARRFLDRTPTAACPPDIATALDARCAGTSLLLGDFERVG